MDVRATADLETFVAVIDAGGFSLAARHLGLSQPAVSRRVAALERRLGTQLLSRIGRRLRLTAAGQELHQRCGPLLAELRRIERAASADRGTAGTLRVTAPPALARRLVVPGLVDFHARHPEIRIALDTAERFAELADGGFDVALRLFTPGRHADLVTRRLASFAVVPCAAPAYLARRGTPRTPADLAAHDCLILAATREHADWSFRGDGRDQVRVTGPLATNDVDALRVAAVSGLGVALLPAFAVDDDLRARRLRRLLPGFEPPPVPLYAVHGEPRGAPPRTRAFLDFVAAAARRAGNAASSSLASQGGNPVTSGTAAPRRRRRARAQRGAAP